MIKTFVSISFLVLMLLSSCVKFHDNGAKEYTSSMNSTEIENLNEQIVLDEKINEFIPMYLKDDKELSNYIISSAESFDELNLKMFRLLDVAAAFKKEKEDIQKIDNSDALSVGNGALSLGKMLAKGVWSGGKALLSSSTLIDYKTDYLKFKKLYNETKVDSLKYVLNSIAIINLFEDEFNQKQTELIQKGKSVWSINLLPDAIQSKVNFEEAFTKYKKLKLESNKIVKILVFNKMNGLDCSAQLDSQVEDLKNFWSSEQEIYKNDVNLLEDYFDLLSDLKSNILQIRIAIDQSKNEFNDQILLHLNEQLEIYDEEVIQNITELNVYQRIPDIERRLKHKIKNGSDIYFE